MTVAVTAHWLSGLWVDVPVPELPPVGTGAIDPDFGFRFVFHGEDWLALPAPISTLLTQSPEPWSVFSYPDEIPPVAIVAGSSSTLLAAATIAQAGGPEMAALAILIGG